MTTPALQSALHPEGPHAEAVATLGYAMFWGAGVIALVVFALAAYALWGPAVRRGWLAGTRFVIYGGIVFPAIVLVTLFIYSLTLARDLVVPRGTAAALRIEVVAHQWWWRVHYLDRDGSIDFATANELRIPVQQPVELVLRTEDVVHSFWVPSLAGKLDMIPGRVNRLRVTASRAGLFRGQCAEYCGGPHAKMAFHVVAEEPAQFARWVAIQRAAAAEPHDDEAKLGRTLFVHNCSVCHAVRGTLAEGRLGPDLTHFASRRWIAAGVLPNDFANTVRWVRSSQQVKPGNLMPSMDVFAEHELHALAHYLSGLH